MGDFDVPCGNGIHYREKKYLCSKNINRWRSFSSNDHANQMVYIPLQENIYSTNN